MIDFKNFSWRDDDMLDELSREVSIEKKEDVIKRARDILGDVLDMKTFDNKGLMAYARRIGLSEADVIAILEDHQSLKAKEPMAWFIGSITA
jgi:phage-related minor tail protein